MEDPVSGLDDVDICFDLNADNQEEIEIGLLDGTNKNASNGGNKSPAVSVVEQSFNTELVDKKNDDLEENEIMSTFPSIKTSDPQDDDEFDFDSPTVKKETNNQKDVMRLNLETSKLQNMPTNVSNGSDENDSSNELMAPSITFTPATPMRSVNNDHWNISPTAPTVDNQNGTDVKTSQDGEFRSEAQIDDIDVRLSFNDEDVGNNEDQLNDLLAGLSKCENKLDNDDEFEFEDTKHQFVSSKVEESHEFQSESSVVPGVDGHVEQKVETKSCVEELSNQKKIDTTAVLVANGLLSNDTTCTSKPDVQETRALQAAHDEWDTVQTIVPEIDTGEAGPSTVRQTTPIVSYHEAVDHIYKCANLSKFKPEIHVSVHRSGFAAFKHALFGPPKLHKDLHDARDNVFCLALYQLDNSDAIHSRVLQALYRKLTGSKFDCQRYGSHWEQIGFQGNDPATDMRGCGFLGLVQLLHLVSAPAVAPLAREIYRLSLHDVQNFPFAIMGINITRMVIQAMREDVLNKEMNKRKDVMGLVNEFYVAIYYHLYHTWKTQHKTIADTGFVLKDVEAFSKKKPLVLLKNLSTYLKQKKSTTASGVTVEDEPMKFEGVCDFDD